MPLNDFSPYESSGLAGLPRMTCWTSLPPSLGHRTGRIAGRAEAMRGEPCEVARRKTRRKARSCTFAQRSPCKFKYREPSLPTLSPGSGRPSTPRNHPPPPPQSRPSRPPRPTGTARCLLPWRGHLPVGGGGKQGSRGRGGGGNGPRRAGSQSQEEGYDPGGPRYFIAGTRTPAGGTVNRQVMDE
jgi:hypothetical protein